MFPRISPPSKMFLLTLLLLTSKISCTEAFPSAGSQRHDERHNSNLATDINGLASADSQASPFLLLVDEPTEDERRLASAESIESSPSSEENEAAEEEQQDSLSEDSGELLFGKRTASRSRNSQAANGSVGHGELFTRMRGICARMPRLKRKRTPKPGSAESLVAFLCSNTNIF